MGDFDMKKKLTRKERLERIAKIMDEVLNGHNEHERKQIGGCVYCLTCNKRLYQGTL